MLIPVTVGAIVGIIGFLPLAICLNITKNLSPKSNWGYGAVSMLGVVISLVILGAGALICFFVAKDVLVAYALSCAITLCLVALIYGIYVTVRANKAAKERIDTEEKE